MNEACGPSEELSGRKNSLLRMYQEGHMIADHSYNHMLHNAVTTANHNVYVGVEDDIQYFGRMNIDPTISVLREAGVDQHALDQIRAAMTDYIRLPYTNNWRIANISRDCYCSTPNASAENGIALADALQARGASVVGWDLEWGMNYNLPAMRPLYGGATMLAEVNPDGGQLPGKVIVLTHDMAYRPGGDLDAQAELELFIKLAKDKGYVFRTIDTYLSD